MHPQFEAWEGKPYHPISRHYREQFGQRVFKIPIALAETCPNRQGIRGMQTCIFCDEHGSFAYPENQLEDVRRQLELHHAKIKERFNAEHFLVYFQAYTTTFTQAAKLREAMDLALQTPGVVGLVIGTRPDCLSKAVLDLWYEYSQRTYVAVEFGVQSFDDDQLIWMRRGHTAAQAIKAIERTAELKSINVGIHLILGWPTENDKQIIQTAKLCNSLPIQNVKLHNLHVLKNTGLEELYHRGEFIPVEREEYARRVALFLDHLDPRLAVHRLAAVASQWNELIAPTWTRDKMRSFQALIDYFNASGQYQGRLHI